eukprot:m.385646 g.385646  ORF g.385646 m.385646 type:complete len:88 (+) comp16741_c0_seq4:91-354(+)
MGCSREEKLPAAIALWVSITGLADSALIASSMSPCDLVWAEHNITCNDDLCQHHCLLQPACLDLDSVARPGPSISRHWPAALRRSTL